MGRGWSLGTKILLLVAGSMVGLAAVLFTLLAIVARGQIDRAVRRDVVAAGGVQAQLMRDRASALQDQCRLLVRQPAMRMQLGVDRASVDDNSREFAAMIHADAVRITDASGRTLGSAGFAYASGDPGLAAALRGDSYGGIASNGDRLMLSVSLPVVDPVSKVVLETLTASTAIDSRVARDLSVALGSEIAFIDHGRVVGSSLDLPSRIPAPRDAPRLVTLGGKRFFALYAPLPNTQPNEQMGFVALRSYESAMRSYVWLRSVLAFLALLALGFGLGIGGLVSRKITRPLQSVVQAALVVRSGQWPDQLEVRSKDEIGVLQSAFNEMTTAVRASQDRLLALIDTDILTGLDNHRRLQERLDEEARRAMAAESLLCMVIFDIDQFHEFNRRNGHALGDEALAAAGRLIRESLPDPAIAGRYRGGEFAVLLPNVAIDDAERLAETIRSAFTEIRLEDRPAGLTVSVGCAELAGQVSDPESLALASELAVSVAKQLGRNRICRFDNVPGMDHAHMSGFLHDGSYATIQALAAAVDAKDNYTQGHSVRVAEYSARLAAAIGMTRQEVDLVYTTGTLHDVGKIGVPDSILKKRDRLDDEERTLMETHPVLGEVIVRKVPQLAPTLTGVRYHHERWDGKGYPDKLAGEDIPLIARVLAVADTFDAMTSDRPYRKGLAWEIALGEIAKNAGTQFEPRLATKFVEIFQADLDLQKAA